MVISAGKSCAIRPIIARRTNVRKRSIRARSPTSGRPSNRRRRRFPFPIAQREHPLLLRYHDYSRDRIASDQWTGIHANGINTYPLEWTRSWNGLDANPLESIV